MSWPSSDMVVAAMILRDLDHDAEKNEGESQQTYVQNITRFAKVASYETSQETSVSCTQLVVLYAPFQFGSEYNFLVGEQ